MGLIYDKGNVGDANICKVIWTGNTDGYCSCYDLNLATDDSGSTTVYTAYFNEDQNITTN